MESAVDVIIPLYNCEKFILEAIASVEAQSLKPQSIIVVNDGSTDSSLARVQNYHSSLNLLVIDQPNSGVSSARNAGILASKAEFIAFLDADDVWPESKLELVLNQFRESALDNIGAIYTSYEIIDSKGDPILGYNIQKIDLQARGNLLPYLMRGNTMGSPSAVVVKRACIEYVGNFDITLAGGEDHDFWIRIAQSYNCDFVDMPLVKIRVHETNAQKNASVMFSSQLLFMNKWVQLINDKTLLRKWGSDFLLQMLCGLHKCNNFTQAFNTLTKEVKNKLFSIKIGNCEIYFLGLCVSFFSAFGGYGRKVLVYIRKRVFKK